MWWRPQVLRSFAVILGFGIAATAQYPASQTLRVAVDLVLVNVSVTNSNNEVLTDLKREDFTLFEDKTEQQIEYFSSETVPISLGVVFDVSYSMEEEAAIARNAAISFLKNSTQGDEYFLVQFNDNARLAEDFTTNISRLETRLAQTRPAGDTALYDALYVGLNHVRQGQHPRKALLLITDGLDNKSRYSRHNIREMLREADVQVYSIDLGVARIKEFSDITGGRSYSATIDRLEETMKRMAAEMKTQYVLGYASTNTSKNGAWRSIQVKVKSPPKERLTVRARQGYFAEK